MERFGMFGKMVAKPGQRDALVEHLLEASRLLTPLPGCELYIINIVPSEPDAIWVTEVWRSEADHDDSLKMDSVKALIATAKPLIATGSPPIRLVPVGGKGIPSA
jgi:quinol monooxygenase YgiN